MLALPGTLHEFGHTVTREAAERASRNWWLLLLNGALLIVAGVLIFSIDWTVSSLAAFIGALFIVQGVMRAFDVGLDGRVGGANVLAGVLSAIVGVAIIVWPSPGVLAVAIFLGAWLIVVGTMSISGSIAARRLLPSWWLVLVTGILEVALGVLALADPGTTLAAVVIVGGVWAVVIGVMRVVVSFELKQLPRDVDRTFGEPSANGAASSNETASRRLAATH